MQKTDEIEAANEARLVCHFTISFDWSYKAVMIKYLLQLVGVVREGLLWLTGVTGSRGWDQDRFLPKLLKDLSTHTSFPSKSHEIMTKINKVQIYIFEL